MKILYYYHDVCGLGDFYLLFPVFDALRKKHQNAKISLLARGDLLDIIKDKPWFDNTLDTAHTDYPINQYDRVYNWDIQKLGITLFYPPKKHFWDIMESSYDITLDRDNFQNIFQLHLTSAEKNQVDQLLEDTTAPNVVLHTTHSHKFPYGKTPDYGWWATIISKLSNYNFFQVGTKQEDPTSRIIADYSLNAPNVVDLRDELSLRQVAYLIERTDTFMVADSIVAHLSLHSNKSGIVVWGSSNVNTHGHDHNINLEANTSCGKHPCIDLGGFIVSDATNQNCCLMPENAKEDSWPLEDEIIYELNQLIN